MTALRVRSLLVASGLAALTSCSSSESGLTDPGAAFTTVQVNATSATGYLALGVPATTVTVADPTTSTTWDLALSSAPTVAVNGGASGPGGVKAYCLCKNSSLTLAQVEALTATSAATAFGAVTAADIPADASFTADVASQAISNWYDYNATTHAVTPSASAWGVRLATTSGAYAKFHIIALPTPGQSNAGPVTLQWAVQSSATATLGADKQLVVDLTSGAKQYVNLTTGTASTSSSATWDVALQGYTIWVNGGSSGTGNVGAVSLVPSSFYTSYAAITSIPVGATGIPASAFSTDGAGGAFLAAEPYRYDGTSHQIYPTYDVYLVKRGIAVYKVQIISYYNSSAAFGTITVRYAKLAG